MDWLDTTALYHYTRYHCLCFLNELTSFLSFVFDQKMLYS